MLNFGYYTLTFLYYSLTIATAAVGACVTPSGNCRLDYILAAQAGKPAINIYTWNKVSTLTLFDFLFCFQSFLYFLRYS